MVLLQVVAEEDVDLNVLAEELNVLVEECDEEEEKQEKVKDDIKH